MASSFGIKKVLPLADVESQKQDASYAVIEFGGYPVPDGGLILAVPGGGELRVWPDGDYAFEGAVVSDGFDVDTHYGFIVDYFDGTSSVHSFSLSDHLYAEDLPDFQAWSLDDILALEDAVGMFAGGQDAVAELSGFDAGVQAGPGPGSGLGEADVAFDLLEHAIKTSCES